MSADVLGAPAFAAAGGQGPPRLGRASTRSYATSIPTLDLSQDELSVAEDLRSAFIQFWFATSTSLSPPLSARPPPSSAQFTSKGSRPHDARAYWGAVTNHGVDEALVAEVLRQNEAFFALPLEEKLRIRADANFRGYTPFAEETLDPAASRAADSKEGLYFGREVAAQSEEARTTPLTGPNQWPAEAALPGYRAATEAYLAAMTALGRRLVRLIALALRLPPSHFDACFDRPMLFLRPLHYSTDVSDAEGGRFAAGAHTDYGMLTILKTSDVGGLQIRLNGTWIDVDPVPGAFIINIGDMLERWSNGLFRSTLHRVLGHGQERYSLPFFFEPNFNTRVACLPQCCSPDNPPRWPPTTSGQHLLDKYAATHGSYAPKTLPPSA